MSTGKKPIEPRRALELLRDPTTTPPAIAERVGASAAAVDEARCLAEEIETAEVDAILALPSLLGRALLWAATEAHRHDVVIEAASSGDKELVREAKRIAHALKQRGVEVALPAKAPPPTSRPIVSETAEPMVLASSLDAHGERALFWSRNLPGRGVELAQLVLSDERGVVDFVLGELSRKRFRELCEQLPRDGQVTICPIERDDAQSLIARARARGAKTGQVPPSFPSWAVQLFGPIPDEPPPPLRPRGEGAPPEEAHRITELGALSATLFDEPEFARWLPAEDALRSSAMRVEEALSSPLYLEGEAGELQRRDAVTAAIERAAESYFDEARRALYAERLLDMAYVFEKTGRANQAQIAAAAARQLAAALPVVQVPFCSELFGRAFSKVRAPAARGTQAPASSLLVDASDASPAQTPSGLVVPE